MSVATILLDHQVVKGTLLIGLLLGMLGALFLAYHLLGGHAGPLRQILRLAIPGLLGGLAIVPLYLLVFLVAYVATRVVAADTSLESPDLFRVLVALPLTGGFLGVLTALYDTPSGNVPARPTFSRHDALGGLLLALVYVVLNEALAFVRHPFDGMSARDYWIVGTASLLAAMLVAGGSTGLWRGASRHVASETKPPRFTSRTAAIGASVAAAMSVIPNLVGAVGLALLLPQFRSPGMVALNMVVGPLTGLLVVAPAGAIIGGLWPRVSWWLTHAREKRIEIIGILCLLIGFAAQAVEPVVAMLER
jgi:hypothetical protein